MDPARSVVAVTQGLLALLDHRELEGVLAHEISHIGNRDTRLNTVVAAIALFLRLPYLLRQEQKKQQRASGVEWNPIRSRNRIVLTIAMLPIYIYVFFVAPLVAAVIRAAISRSREFLADADAALLTRNPEGLLLRSGEGPWSWLDRFWRERRDRAPLFRRSLEGQCLKPL